jgi:2-amino-4-hydroxy-6-hydroxymethyldihydropteridine diphosphokinase
MSTTALIGLGSNLGDRKRHLDFAVASLCGTPGISVRGVSRYHETAPVGGPDGQGAFLNAAAALATTLDPEKLLEVLHDIETRGGRVRSVLWGERTIDLDLLLYGEKTITTPRLRVPHPRFALRRFVLAPLAEVAPHAVDPVTGRTVVDLLANLDRRPSYVALASEPKWDWRELFDCWLAAHGQGPALHKGKAPPPDASVRLRERLGPAVPAAAVEERISDSDRMRVAEQRFLSHPLPASSDGGKLIELASDWLDAQACSALVPDDGWLVSHFWFDALFLSLDSLKSLRPRFPAFVSQFQEARRRVLSPTFVVAQAADCQRFRLLDPRYAWRRPIGWDTPVLVVDDFASDATLTEILTACTATRTR